jgi:8-oxo-dGTP pyrophosphatase MutT (NUDIX family)
MSFPGYEADNMTHEQRGGVAILVQRPDGLILSVARKDNHEVWTLPGGKRDLGEDFLTAAEREFQEEIGYTITLPEIIWADINDWNGKICITYKTDFIDTAGLASIQTFQSPPGEAPVSWQPASVLANGPFGEYNKRLFQHMGISYEPDTPTDMP